MTWLEELRAGNTRAEYAREWKSGWESGTRSQDGRITSGRMNLDLDLLVAEGIPQGANHDDTLYRVVYKLAAQGHSKDYTLMVWSAIVSKTAPKDPDDPFRMGDFGRNWGSALGDLRAKGLDPGDQPEAVVLPGVPEYPLSQVAGPLGDLVRSTPLPAALVGGAGLAVLAALSSDADLIMPDSSREVPVVWIPLIAPRSGAKTPALTKRAMPPLYDLEGEAHERFQRENAEWKELPDPLRLATPRPADPTLLVDDLTLEALGRKLNRGTGAALVSADELSGFLQSIGQYKRVSGDKGRWLSLWSGVRWPLHRVGAARDGDLGIALAIERPVVSIVGGLQPHLHYLLGDDDSGHRARWLPHLSTARAVPYDRWTQQGHDGWHHAVHRMGRFRGQRRNWHLQGPALDMWEAQSAEWKRQLVTEANSSAAAALGKADLYAARVSLIIAESVACLGDPHPALTGQPVIPEVAMHSAIAIVEYAMAVWRSLPSQERLTLSYREEKLDTAVEKLREWLEARPERKASRSELLLSKPAGIRNKKILNAVLAEYEETYPGTIRQEAPEHGGPTGTYVHAPARANSASPYVAHTHTPPLLTVNNEGGSSSAGPEIAAAGQGVAEITEPVLTGVNTEGVNNEVSIATVTAGSGSAEARTPPEIAPQPDPATPSLGSWPLGTAPPEIAQALSCTRCGKPAETTGSGPALCGNCMFTFEQKGPS
jgi:hypothetical protein